MSNNTENVKETENDEIDEEEEDEDQYSTSSSSNNKGPSSSSPSLKRRLRNSQERTIVNSRLEDFGDSAASTTTTTTTASSKSISTNKSSPKATTSRTTRKELTIITKRVEVETEGEYEGEEGLEEAATEPLVVQRRPWISENNIIHRCFRQLLENWYYIAYALAFIGVFTIFARASWEDVPSTTKNGYSSVKTVSPGMTWLNGQNQFKESIKNLQKKYPSQPSSTWIQIYSAITSTMTEEKPKQPSSIVFLTHPSVNTEFASCLSHEIAVKTHSVFYNITGQQYTRKILKIDKDYLNSIGTVTEIHDDLKTYLNNGKVVIIQDIEKINKPEHLYIFHAFCDNSAAPDKRATFIFIVPVPDSILNEYEWKQENSATISQEIFTSAWTSLSPDKRPALIARVAATVLMIQPGDTCRTRSGKENNNNNDKSNNNPTDAEL